MTRHVGIAACAFLASAFLGCGGETTALDGPAPGTGGGSADAAADGTVDGQPADASHEALDDSSVTDGPLSDGPVGDGDAVDSDAQTLAPVGAACDTSVVCAGDFCITEALGFPGGYCSYAGCDLAAPESSCLPYGGDGICMEAGQASLAMCFDRCVPDASDCRTDYVCRTVSPGVSICLPKPVCGNGTVEVGEECEPPGTSTCDAQCLGLGAAPVGAACAGAADCAGNFCIDEWPDGYCTQYDCDLGAPGTACEAAGGDGYCWDIGEPGQPFGVCLDRCDPAAQECRAGYRCMPVGGGMGLCAPEPVCGNGTVESGEECEPPGTATCDADCQGFGALPVGDPCATPAECAGNYCIVEWPAGYCTQFGCDLAAPDTACLAAGGDGYCYDFGDQGSPFGVCLDRCDPAAPDCRAAYQCTPLAGGLGLCTPEPVCGNGKVEAGEECEPPGTATCDADCQGFGALPVGDACGDAGECAGNYCIAEWPAGYCTQYGCDLAAPDTSCLAAGGDGVCMDVGDDTTPFGICLDRCEPASPDCRTGYQCGAFPGGLGLCMPTPVCGNGVVEYGEECEPPGTATCNATCQGLGALPVGQACTGPGECAGNLCIGDWPAGYCSQLGCDVTNAQSSCASAGGDGYCVDVGDSGTPVGICLDRCSPLNPDCRTDYECMRISLTAGLCLPIPQCGNGLVERGEECEPPGTATCDVECQGPGTAPTGVPCANATECAGNLCLQEASGWDGGYCSQADCDPFSTTSCQAYGPDAVCGVLDLFGAIRIVCLDGCKNANDCRTGYQCQWVGIGGNACVPE